MSIKISDMASAIDPKNTVLFFGSGSSVPSGAPSVQDLMGTMSSIFSIPCDGYSLCELAGVIEMKEGRRPLIDHLRKRLSNVKPTGSLLNFPLYEWKSIYTTNYDNLIEDAYSGANVAIESVSSNFDFQVSKNPEAIKLFKIHGTIEKDEVDGVHSRIIISDNDYDLTSDYRETLYDSLRNDLNQSDLVIIGSSLSDPHIREIVNRALDIHSKSHCQKSIYLVLYTEDENRALLYERRGVKVAFGGIDQFVIALQECIDPKVQAPESMGDALEVAPRLRPMTTDISHEIGKSEKNASAMFNGWPASFADIKSGLTFQRSAYPNICEALHAGDKHAVVLLGPSGIGKTTLAKQVLLKFSEAGWLCWQHKEESTLLPDDWIKVARKLKAEDKSGILFIDNAHIHLFGLNILADALSFEGIINLRLFMISSRNMWNPRVKSSVFFRSGEHFHIKSLDSNEVESLLNLVDSCAELKPLVENSFAGFSRAERKRRLTVRCESDTFVCLKNVFGSEKFDDIILREFASLDGELQEIYKIVAAMESSGINVHRQLIVRVLGINAGSIGSILDKLTDIIREHVVSERQGIYGWKGRHSVIMDIVTKYKMTDLGKFEKLFEDVIENIVPTYDIEVRTIRQLCGFEKGIGRFPDKHIRNKLLRRMISKVPGERIPRHRLIKNLIDINEMEKAETEIRLFENDFRADGPVHRYKIMLLVARAERTPGLMDEDRLAILQQAHSLAVNGCDRYKDNKDMLKSYCDVGMEIFKRTGEMTVLDQALEKVKAAEERVGDPELTNIINVYQRMITCQKFAEGEGDDGA